MSTYKNIKGGAELQRFLNALPAKVEANVMRSALRAGARVIMQQAKHNVPVHDGDLRDSIRVGTRLKNGTAIASVKAGNKKAWYWRFVEYGTAAHEIMAHRKGFLSFAGIFKRSIHHPGARPHPFMRPALDAKANDAIVAVAAQVKKRLTKQGINTADLQIEVDE